jgi:glyoxylase-like metal-dependent hydrolase (beta-lactamase superfamily II)
MENKMHQSSDHHSIPMTSVSSGKGREVAYDLYYYTDQIVNIIFVGVPNSDTFVLVDAGMPNSAHKIISEVEDRFGKGAIPEAIVLTHGHFDHVGSIVDLLEKWGDVPVYAHMLEFPFLSGEQDYPEPDATVEGGMLAKISRFYPHKAINIAPVLRPLPSDGSVPAMPGWKWIFTPGHSPGHVSFFRESDKVLLSGDAFITVKQDSFYKVFVQKEEVQGPPRYLTTDWDAAKQSVLRLNELHPVTVISGHGTHMSGTELMEGLQYLADKFDEVALPKHGEFVSDYKRDI